MPSLASSGHRRSALEPGRKRIILLLTHRDGLRRGSRFSAARVTRKISTLFKTVNRAIVAAKLHRLRNELMLHRSAQARIKFDAAKFPQRPMSLGDKWDF
jgi:hypothetical protein